MGLEVVATYLQPMEAEAACGALRAAGMNAEVLNREIGISVPYHTQGFRVAVPVAELAAATALLAALPAQIEDLPEADAIPRRIYGRGWIAPALLLLSGLSALWGVSELVWWAFLAADGAGGVVPPAIAASMALISVATIAYLASAYRLHRRLGGAALVWLIGWLAAMTGDGLTIWQSMEWAAANPGEEAWSLGSIFHQYLRGHILIGILGAAVWWIEAKDAAESAPS